MSTQTELRPDTLSCQDATARREAHLSYLLTFPSGRHGDEEPPPGSADLPALRGKFFGKLRGEFELAVM